MSVRDFYKQKITVARVYGIPVRIDYRWFVVFALSVWLIEMKNWGRGTGFFYTFGKNALFAYILSEALVGLLFAIPAGENGSAFSWIYQTFFVPLSQTPEWSSFYFALVYMLFCWVVCRFLWVKKIFLKI